MYLKHLEIQGFKSFPDKTRIEFGRGLTAVVGPNGSGKSNISDAVRWVLGEQSTKTLRGDKMEDVIFSGTKARKPLGFAEVSLTIDNHDRVLGVDTDEVTITRRYDRTGESEYCLNRSPVRLKDIHELLMDTGLGKDGYSLIGQNKIASIVQSKSGERRDIFEEAAGISKFRHRKLESERSLARAEENLLRLRDILSELEARVGPLKEQSEKAKRFLELSEARKSLEISLWIDTIDRSNLAVKDQSDRLTIAQERYAAAEEQVESIEKSIEAAYATVQQQLVESENLRRRKAELEAEIADATSGIAVCENDISHYEQDIRRIEGEIAGQTVDIDATLEEIRAKEQELNALQERLARLQDTIAAKEAELEQLLQTDESWSQQERERNASLNELILAQSRANMTISTAELNEAELAQTIGENQTVRAAKEAELAAYEQERREAEGFLAELDERAESLQNAYSGYKLKYDSRAQNLEATKRDYEKTDLAIKERLQKCRLLEGMEQSLEGYAFSVREVLKRAKNGMLNGILGTVSQLIEVKAEYSTAIETAIGGAMQNIVVEQEGAAKAAIRLLQQENLGRATFLPLTSVKGNTLQEPGLERYAGFIDLAVNLVDFDEPYRGVMNSLLGRIAIVDDIDTAVLIAKKYGYRFKLVTLDGQVVNAGGSMTGGSKDKRQGFLSRKNEIQALRAEVGSLQAELAKKQASMQSLQQETSRLDASLTAVSAEITTVNEDRIRAQGEQKRLEQLITQGQELLASMDRELEQKRARREELAASAQQARAELASCEERMAALLQELEEIQEQGRASADETSRLSQEINALRLEEITLGKDMEAVHTAIAALQERRSSAGDAAQRLEADKNDCAAKIAEIRAQIEALHTAIAGKQAAQTDIDAAVRAALERRQAAEAETTSLRQQTREAQEEKGRLAQEIARIEERRAQIQNEFDQLIAKLWEEYELTRSEAAALAQPLEDLHKAQSELTSLRNRIRALGNVNVAAIEEYQEVSERYEFLSGQMHDAEQSKAELLRLIEDLTRKMQDIFLENFEKINHNFQRIFVELFGGGRGELRLSDPSNLLETGIDIIVEPPGKIVKNLSLLSGGEQSFVAIAIYFAILKVHPAPFCILDEIEAALDDVNVDKYAAYLKSMVDRTQFITITHRRGTMEAADILYGVTMQDEGISKLLQLKASEVGKTLELPNA